MGADRRLKRRSFFAANTDGNMLTNFYIDGFNLYHRALKRPPSLKWLNLAKLAQILCPSDQIGRIHYFTARVIARRNDPSQPQRQQTYWRALETLPNVEIHRGTFRNRFKSGELINPQPSAFTIATIKAPEEKRSDVNLATQLLIDAFNEQFEKAAIITDDSDFVVPMRYVRDNLGFAVDVFNPAQRKTSNTDLENASTNLTIICRQQLATSQFPNRLNDAQGRTITKPRNW